MNRLGLFGLSWACLLAGTLVTSRVVVAAEPLYSWQSDNTELAAATSGIEYRTELTASGKYVVGQAGMLRIKLEPIAPYKCNDQYPYRFKLAANAGAEFPQLVVTQAEVSHQQVTLAIPFTPKAPGSLRIAGEFSLSVCTEEKCVVQKVPLDTVVTVVARPD